MKMTKLIRSLILSIIIVSVLTSCSWFANTTDAKIAQATPALPAEVTIKLTVQVDDSVPYNVVGQVIQYNYKIKNTGSISTPGPVTVTGATVTCPEISTIGNLDNALDPKEVVVCTSTYPITQADLDKGSVTSITTATVNGINSDQVTTTVGTVPPVTLKLTKTANPVTYDHVGQTVTYAYVITNSGIATLGPAQFTVSDTGIGTPINCGDATLTLASNATVTCSATYTITQADMNAASVATNATASGGGIAPSQPASATITKSAAVVPVNPNPANLTAGSTINHQVVVGEWLWQIARCYGTDPFKVVQANPQLSNPAQISPNTTITVPNIGSAGKIYGPPCVGTHTVQSGDTWNSIALKYNADPTVLQMVNSNTLTVGSVVKVPLNSAGFVTTTGSTGTCVDLTRSLKLAGVNANTTHFNVCGVVDASGKMKIGTIKVYQRPEDVGLGGLLQDITVLIETSTALNDANSLIVGDMNYDSNDDFRIVKNQPAGPNIPYLYYIYDPATRNFVYNKAYENITSPEFPGNSEIRSKWRESATKSGIDTYTIANNTPRLTKRETWEAINATQATHIVTVFNADGTSQVTVNETVPLPIP
jgi:LysM repeat protein